MGNMRLQRSATFSISWWLYSRYAHTPRTQATTVTTKSVHNVNRNQRRREVVSIIVWLAFLDSAGSGTSAANQSPDHSEGDAANQMAMQFKDRTKIIRCIFQPPPVDIQRWNPKFRGKNY